MEYKDGRAYWTDPDKIEETSFLLSDLPEDRRIVVDGHTTSPIFADEHQQLIVNGDEARDWSIRVSAIEIAAGFQGKDTLLIQRIRDKAEAKQAAAHGDS